MSKTWPLLALWAAALGCQARDRVVAIHLDGASDDAGLGPFTGVRLIEGLLDPLDAMQDPSLSGDELEIYFSSIKAGTFDIWKSTRLDVSQPWPRATRVDELSTADRDYEPALSDDGLTIYVAQDVGPHFQIFVFQRASRSSVWGKPQLVPLGDPPTTDRGATVDLKGVSLVFSSDRGGDYDLYQSARANQTDPWGAPVPIAELNTIWQDWDANLFLDGLALAFGSRRDGDHQTTDLYETRRPTLAAPFGAIIPMTTLNSPFSEGDPWLSNDGHHVVFSSDRDGFSRLYEARR